ncbi:MAG: Uma2 family endonuclease [Streptomyces sp.]
MLRRVGLRVEIHAEHPAPPPPRCGKHAGVVRLVRLRLSPRLPRGLVVVEGVSVEIEGLGDGDQRPAYVTPDLTVCPAGFLASDERLLHPQDVEIAVEVVTADATREQVVETVGRYAGAGVRALLVVDPRTDPGSWTLHTEPVAGNYWLTRPGRYGEPVSLTSLGGSLATDRLPRYVP